MEDATAGNNECVFAGANVRMIVMLLRAVLASVYDSEQSPNTELSHLARRRSGSCLPWLNALGDTNKESLDVWAAGKLNTSKHSMHLRFELFLLCAC